MQNKISFIGIAGVLIGLVILFSTSSLPELSALFPRTVAGALIIAGAIECLRNYVAGVRLEKHRISIAAQGAAGAPVEPGVDEDTDSGSGGQNKPVLIFTVATVIYVVLIPVIGFYVMTIVFLGGLMLALGIRKIFLYLGLPIILTAIIYLTFTVQLKVPLPEGVLL